MIRSRTVVGPEKNAAGRVHPRSRPPIRICAHCISASRNRTTKQPNGEFGDVARQTPRKLSLKCASGECSSVKISMNSEGLRRGIGTKNVVLYQILIRGGPKDIRTSGPIAHDAPLKYQENLPGECLKCPTENFSRASCECRRSTPWSEFSAWNARPGAVQDPAADHPMGVVDATRKT